MSLFKRIQQRLNEATVTGDTENTVDNSSNTPKKIKKRQVKIDKNSQNNSSQNTNNSSQNTSKPKVTTSTTPTTDSGRRNTTSNNSSVTTGIGDEFKDKRLKDIKKQIDAENPTIKSADGKGNIPDTKANRIKVEKEKIKFKELQDKIKKENLKNQPLKTQISNKLKTYYKKINPSQISKLLKAARKNKYVKWGTATGLTALALYNKFKPQSNSKTNTKIKDQTQTQTELQNNNNNNKKLTTTDNNNNNNKGIVTPPNNDKKVKLKPGIPIIYKFGLGVNDKKSK